MSTPKHYFPTLRGAPIIPGPRRDFNNNLRLNPPAPEEFTQPARRPAIPRAWSGARDLAVFHISNGAFIGDAPDTIRRPLQVDLDTDLNPDGFAELVDGWPYLGRFNTAGARDEFLEALRRVLGWDEGGTA